MALYNALDNSNTTREYFDYTQSKEFTGYTEQELRSFFYNRDLTEESKDEFTLVEWQQAVAFHNAQQTQGHFITGYTRQLFPAFLNEAFEKQQLCLFVEQDYPTPTYCFVETAQDVFAWEEQYPEHFKIIGWDEVMREQVRPAYAAAQATGAQLFYQGILCPLEDNPDGVGLVLEAIYLVDPTEAQVTAVQEHTGELKERELFEFFDVIREHIRQAEGYEQLKYYYSKDRIIAGTSWAWGF